jgi:hypothetical protein
MTKERYTSIRNKSTFLHEYFMESGGKRISHQEFEIALDAWLTGVLHIHPAPGRMVIHQYLDGIQRS